MSKRVLLPSPRGASFVLLSLLSTSAFALEACGSDDDDTVQDSGTDTGSDGGTSSATDATFPGDSAAPSDATTSGHDSATSGDLDAAGGVDASGDTGAGSSTDASDAGDASAAEDAGDASDASDASDAGLTAYSLYDQDIIPEFALSVPTASYAVLTNTDTSTENTWVTGDITITSKFGTETITNVGIRRKGASTFVAAPDKTSLKIEFNKYVKGQKFHGLTDLTLNNMLSENSFLAERLSYYVYRAANLPAELGNTGHVSITDPVNGKVDYGIYFNVETLDQDFLTRVYGKANAKTLYESNGGGTWQPQFATADYFDEHVGTDYSDLLVLFNAATNANAASLLTDVAPHLDTTEFLKFCALEGLVGQIDGYGYGIYGSHNNDIGGDVNDLFTMVPWSLDLTFSDSTSVMNMANPMPATQGGTDLTFLGRCKADTTAGGCWATYKTTVSEMITLYNGLDLVTLAQTWHAQIDALASADPKKHISTAGYEAETTKMYTWIPNSSARAKTDLGLP